MEISNFDGVFDDGRVMKLIPAGVEQFCRLLYGVQIPCKNPSPERAKTRPRSASYDPRDANLAAAASARKIFTAPASIVGSGAIGVVASFGRSGEADRAQYCFSTRPATTVIWGHDRHLGSGPAILRFSCTCTQILLGDFSCRLTWSFAVLHSAYCRVVPAADGRTAQAGNLRQCTHARTCCSSRKN